MDNLDIYNSLREVPKEAKKPITAGRLKGFTDINPMWRIKKLTETFGPCGIGWYFLIKDRRLETGADDTVCCFLEIDLFYHYQGEWSKPVPGMGGSSFVAKERKGLFTSDECFKMALTDAIGNAAKNLGLGADVYFEKDRSKYDSTESIEETYYCERCSATFKAFEFKNKHYTAEEAFLISKKKNQGIALCSKCAEEKKLRSKKTEV